MKRFTGDPVFPIKSLNPGPNLASWSADECGEQSAAFDPAEPELHAVGDSRPDPAHGSPHVA